MTQHHPSLLQHAISPYTPKANSPVVGAYMSSGAGLGWTCPYYDQLGHSRDFYEPGSWSIEKCNLGAEQFNWTHW
jgi:hypothetical protein